MKINRTGNKQGGTFKCNSLTEVTPNQMRSSACKMVRTLVQLMRTLDRMPEERTILMKLFYYDDVTPVDYKHPFFRSCTKQEAHNPWTKNPLKMELGYVNSKHFVLALKVKSVLDPCEDENYDIQDYDVSLGADSVERDEHSESDSEVSHSQDNECIVAPIDKQQNCDDNGMVDEDDTEDPVEDEHQLGRVKDWISCYHLATVELTNVLSNFPDVSMVLIEEIMDKLVKEGILSKSGTDSYTINKQKESAYKFNAVKEEMDVPDGKKAQQGMGEDHMYMKALYHALPMNYITATKLQDKLEGEANKTTARKLIDKMTHDGFLDAKSNRRLGKRVIHSDLTEKKLMEVKKVLDIDAMDLDINESHNKSNHVEFQKIGINKDMSTCGMLHSIGSDLTSTRGGSETHQNGSLRSEQNGSRARDHGNAPTSRAEELADEARFWGAFGFYAVLTAAYLVAGLSGGFLTFSSSVFMLPAWICFCLSLKSFGRQSLRSIACYVVPLIPCLAYSVYFGGFIAQFLIEKMGMMGSLPPPHGYFVPDIVVAALTGVVTGWCVGPLIPVLGHWLARSAILQFLLQLTVISMALSSRFFPYSIDAPKRVVFQHTVLTTDASHIVDTNYEFSVVDSNSLLFVFKHAPEVAKELHICSELSFETANFSHQENWMAIYPVSFLFSRSLKFSAKSDEVLKEYRYFPHLSSYKPQTISGSGSRKVYLELSLGQTVLKL